jgi:hypothetical protein
MSSENQSSAAPPNTPPNGPDYGFYGSWPLPFPPFGAPHSFGLPPFAMPYPGAPPYPPPSGTMPFSPQMSSPAAAFEATRQLFISRAGFWYNMMQSIAHMASEAARVAAEARKATEMLGPGGANFFAPPGGPYGPPVSGGVDVDKLKQALQGMDQTQAAQVLYAVQMVQAMDAARRSSPNPARPADPW